MKIVVCIKRVVDTETRVKVASDGRQIELGGVRFIMAPYDEMAVEKALQLRDGAGGGGAGGDGASSGTVTVLTVGPAAATKELRTALAMGADDAVHVTTDEVLDASATAAALASVIKDREADMILCGKQATDDDDAAVGPMLAALLDLPCVAFVSAIDVADGVATVRREIEGEAETLAVTLPAVLTAQKGLAEARYPGLKGIMAAKKKPLASEALGEATSRTEVRSLELPAARAAMVTIEPTADGMNTLLSALRNDKKVL